MITNYPVYPNNKSHYFKDYADYFQYMKENPYHLFSPKYYRNGYFSTEHSFPDGLLINLVWKLNDKTYEDLQKEVGHITSVSEIAQLVKLNWITCIHGDVWEYSKGTPEEVPPEMVKTVAKKQLYRKMEYEVIRPSSIPDAVFDTLVEEVTNHIRFEQYLKEKELK